MALTYTNAIDPRLEALSPSQDFVIPVPQGSGFTNKVIQPANQVSRQSVSFNYNAPNKNTLIDRRIYCRIRFSCVVFGITNVDTANSLQPFPTGTFCPRSFPLASVSERITVSINGTSVSSNYSDVMYAFQHFASPDTLFAYDLSQTPTQLDFFSNYDDNVANTPTTGRQPHTSIINTTGKQLPRSAFNLISYTSPEIPPATVVGGVTVPSVGTANFVFEVVEPIMISPLLYASSKLESGFINIDNIAITINFGDLNRACSIRSVVAINSLQTSLVGIPELLFECKNINMIDENKIPPIVRYKYDETVVYKTQFPDIVMRQPSATTFFRQTLTSNPIDLSVCPKKIYIYVCRRKHDNDVTQPFQADFVLPITSLSLSYLNIPQFANYSQNDLYTMSRKNGYEGSFQEWSGLAMTYNPPAVATTEGLNGRIGLAGGIICIDSTDLSLPSTIASGVNISSQLRISVTAFNQNDDDDDVENPELIVIIVNDGIMEIGENKMTARTGYINQQDVISIRSNGEITPQAFQSQLSGSGVFDVFKKAVSKVGDVVNVGKDVYDIGKKIGVIGGGSLTLTQNKKKVKK